MKRALMNDVAPCEETAKIKVTVVGAGAVGMAVCFSIACQVV